MSAAHRARAPRRSRQGLAAQSPARRGPMTSRSARMVGHNGQQLAGGSILGALKRREDADLPSQLLGVVSLTRGSLCEPEPVSIWANLEHIGTDDRVHGYPPNNRGAVLSYAVGFSNHYPEVGGNYEQPSSVVLSSIPAWCVPGQGQRGLRGIRALASARCEHSRARRTRAADWSSQDRLRCHRRRGRSLVGARPSRMGGRETRLSAVRG
jgi:hypothetical protein